MGKEQPFFKVKKRNNPHMSLSNWLETDFRICYTIFGCLSISLRKTIFMILTPQYPFLQIWAQMNFDPKLLPFQNIKSFVSLRLFPKFYRFRSVWSWKNNFFILGETNKKIYILSTLYTQIGNIRKNVIFSEVWIFLSIFDLSLLLQSWS